MSAAAPDATAAGARLVLGAMNLGRRTPEALARPLTDAARAAGIAWVDTANLYGDGASERLVGRLLSDAPEVQVATKVGLWRREGLSPAAIRDGLAASLARLGRTRVDLLFLHVPDPETPVDATLGALAAALDDGRIGAFGLSNFAAWQALEVLHACDRLGLPRPVAAQQLYNPLVRTLDLEWFGFARRYSLPTWVYNPLAGGLLTSRFLDAVDADTLRRAPALAGTRFERNGLYQRRYLSDTLLRSTRALAEVAADAGRPLAELAYAWLLAVPGVDRVILGPGEASHLTAPLCALSAPLTPEQQGRVDAIHRAQLGTEPRHAR